MNDWSKQTLKKDYSNARKGELVVLEILNAVNDGNYVIEDLSNNYEKYGHCGDIRIHDNSWDLDYYIDVKMDSCIGKTKKVLCEHMQYFYHNGGEDCDIVPGFMQACNYDYLAVLSVERQKLFILDFKQLKKYYKKGIYKRFNWPQKGQASDTYLYPISLAKKDGVLEEILHYDVVDGKYIVTREYNRE